MPGIDTRPGPLRDWLLSLPYVDAENITVQVLERLRHINHQPLSASQRLELLAAFRHSYDRLHDALRDHARQHRPQPIPRALTLLTDLTEAMSFGYKYALRDASTETQRWGKHKHLNAAVNYTLHFLALLLLCRYHAYLPVSDQHWHEIGDIVRFAEAEVIKPTQDSEFPYSTGKLHALSGYTQLAMLRLADPYRLPGGLVWEAFGYLATKSEQIAWLAQAACEQATGIYSLSLDCEPHSSATAPNSGVERSSWRCLDARELLHAAQQDLERVQSGTAAKRLGFSNRLTASDATQLLNCMLGQWTHVPDRAAPRFVSAADIELAPGLDAAYYFLNDCVAFNAQDYVIADDDDDDDIDFSARTRQSTLTPNRDFRLLACPTRNRSSGGLALHLSRLHGQELRVGQLVVINMPGTGSGHDWLVGVVRWFQSLEDDGAEIGVQYIARNSQPVAFLVSTSATRHYQAALKSQLPLANGQQLLTLITPKGVFRNNATLEIHQADQLQRIRCEHLIESGSGFDRFSYEVLT